MKVIKQFQIGNGIGDTSKDRVIVTMSLSQWTQIVLGSASEETLKECEKASKEALVEWID